MGGAYQCDSPESRRMSPNPKCIKEWRLQHVEGIKRRFDVKEKKRKMRSVEKKESISSFSLSSCSLRSVTAAASLSPCLLLLLTLNNARRFI